MATEKIKALLSENKIITEDSDEARELFNQGAFGAMVKKQIELSLLEGVYLSEKGKLVVFNQRNKEIPNETLLKKAKAQQKNFWIKFCVFRDMRNRGYIVKTALKFGAEFRVYDRGIKPGEDHARWILYPVHESSTSTWHEFAAKNRVAHSTKKRLLIGVVDDEGEVSYWEVRWLRP
ncbi:MAG: tRNA-intron lyase [Candidatus Woesearchaeota archaeon]|nr:tRNA-intron lyase [Candidatus Woesearchaeota archaeon]MDP7324387.1 tRNA-intron lyase [Candidatus Woesearchaeota archaeon]MDP7457795.1 tRNA-intron lyase [Candidatus Woesearchaeota archaeon]